MDIKLQFQICLQIILGFWFGQMWKDVAAVGNHASYRISNSVSDANLMFEFLLGGVEIDQDNIVDLLDEEMASMRQGRAFLSQINDNIPKTRSSMEQMLDTLEGQEKAPLSPTEFESLALSMVYSAYQSKQQEGKAEQLAWSGVLLRLANVTVSDLRGHYLIAYA
ncbi:protein FAM180A [Myripristis murdjan]|uniref:protein FAM180A n=1 Tax=Myripristis murdjan TaxID=586833 RepID=UPI0011760B4D|nr:protein FAM180A-like [Myripristis murdjan]